MKENQIKKYRRKSKKFKANRRKPRKIKENQKKIGIKFNDNQRKSNFSQRKSIKIK